MERQGLEDALQYCKDNTEEKEEVKYVMSVDVANNKSAIVVSELTPDGNLRIIFFDKFTHLMGIDVEGSIRDIQQKYGVEKVYRT